MRIWDSIRRFSGHSFRQQNTGLFSSRTKKKEKVQKRPLQIEQFEDRILLSINTPELNAIFVNQDETQYFDPALSKEFNTAPQSFLLRFNEGQQLDPATLGAGIQVVRAGTDGKFGTADDVLVNIGWIGLNGSKGDGKDVVTTGNVKTLQEGIVGNEVVIRFAESLPDDQYQIRLIGTGNKALKNLDGDVFHDGQNQTVSYKLDLGAYIVSVVPQPTYHKTDGTLAQYRNRIDIYFNANDPLKFPATVTATSNSEYLKLFQLIATKNTVSSGDDVVFYPTQISYDAKTGKMVLTFAKDLDQLDSTFDGVNNAFRLRVGDLYTATQTKILDLVNAEPGDAFHTSYELTLSNLNTQVTGPQSLVIHGQINPLYDPMQYPGGSSEPGSRDLPNYENNDTDDNLIKENHTWFDQVFGGVDTTNGPSIVYYNFKAILGYDDTGKVYRNEITEAQKNLARQVFQVYSRYLGVEFIEDTNATNPAGIIVATGDLAVDRDVLRTSKAGDGIMAVGGYMQVRDSVSNSASRAYYNIALMDSAENWETDVYGGKWFTSALQAIGYSLGYSYANDLPVVHIPAQLDSAGNVIVPARDVPSGTVMGTSHVSIVGNAEPIYLGDYDIVHGQYMFRPDSNDIDVYKFDAKQGGWFSAETYAQRQDAASTLDTVLALYRQVTASDGKITYELISRNDDYFGKDSFLEMYLEPGTYYIGVSSTGNDRYDPSMEGTGEGGTTSGNYELRLNFNPETPASKKDTTTKANLIDLTGTKFDGDNDGTPGGVYDFWFNVQTQAKTLYVDKIAAAGGNGTIQKPYNTIQAALAAAKEGDIVRIVGNNFDNDKLSSDPAYAQSTLDNKAYQIGVNRDNKKVLEDGADFNVPKGVTVVIDEGAILKFADANVNVGSFMVNVDRSGGSIQVLGTPKHNVIFTSFYDQTIGTNGGNPFTTVPQAGDWGGISIRNDLDYAFIDSYDPASGKTQREVLESQGIFLNYINNADFRYGGSSVTGLTGTYAPVTMKEARPTVTFNRISNSKSAAMSADVSSFTETRFESWDHDAKMIYTLDYNRIGPMIRGNFITNNTVNGIYVFADTPAGGTPQKVTDFIRFDDTDIVHVLQENIVVQGIIGEYATSATTAPSLGVGYGQYGLNTSIVEDKKVDIASPDINDPDHPAYPLYFESAHTSAGNAKNDSFYDNTLSFNKTPGDGEYFTLFDGTTSLTFEFNHIDTVNQGGGVKAGRVQVDILSTDTATVAAKKLADVINSFSMAAFKSNYAKYIPVGGTSLTKPFKISAVQGSGVNSVNISLKSTGTNLDITGTGLVKSKVAGRMMFDPGIVVKSYGTRMEAEMGAQIIAEGTADHPIIMTSLYDTRYGAGGTFNTGNSTTKMPAAGNWSGIFFSPDSKGSLDHIVLAFGGGTSRIEGDAKYFDAVEIHQADVRVVNSRFEYNSGYTRGQIAGRGSADPAVIFVRGAQPVIVNNEFFNNTNGRTNSADSLAVVSINANALSSRSVIDWGRSTGSVDNFSEYDDNYGAMVRDNRYTGNGLNGMIVRGEVLTTAGIWDDADIAHILFSEVIVANYHSNGGLRLLSAPGNSLIVKILDTDKNNRKAGFTTTGIALEMDNRVGGAIELLGAPKYPVVLTSLYDDSVGAGRDLKKQVMFDTNNDGSATKPSPGDWRSVKFGSYSNDRNVAIVSELEKVAGESEDQNGTPAKAQYIGQLATEDKAGDDTLRLGYEILGSIRSDHANEADVYKFKATPGTEVWLDIDKTTRDLDLILEVVDGSGNVLARSDNSYMEEYGNGSVYTAPGIQAFTMNKDRWNGVDNYSQNQRDPGMRFIIPGPGTEYYVRVRSALGMSSFNKITAAASDGKTFTITDNTSIDSTTGKPARVATFRFDYSKTGYSYTGGQHIIGMKGVGTTEDEIREQIVKCINAANLPYVTARTAMITGGDGKIIKYAVLDGVELVFNPLSTGLTCLENSYGSYQLQIRLQELDEVPGCSVTYADIRYAVNGIEAYGFPQHSPIQAEYTSNNASSGTNQTFAGAMNLENLLASDTGTISVSGKLSSLSQVDWYKFDLNYRGTQVKPTSSNEGNIWSAIFDIDYADGKGGPDLMLWVFDQTGRLIYIGSDSNVPDDQYDPNLSSSIEKLSAGSAGPYDPFIGPVNLKAGLEPANSDANTVRDVNDNNKTLADKKNDTSKTYYVAVTSATMAANVLKSAQTRLEPVDSVKRIAEERVDQGQDMDKWWSGTGWDATEIEAAERLTLTPDEYHLGDVVTYVNTGGALYMINPFTGATQVVRYYGADGNNRYDTQDIDIRFDGRLFTTEWVGGGDKSYTFSEINQGDYRRSQDVSGILSQVQNKDRYGANNGWRTNDLGYQIRGLTTAPYLSLTGTSPQTYTVVLGSMSTDGGGDPNDPTLGVFGTRNVLYILGSNGQALSHAQNGTIRTAGTDDRHYSNATPIGIFDSTAAGLMTDNERLMSVTFGNDGILYTISNTGAIYRITNPTAFDYIEVDPPSGSKFIRKIGNSTTLQFVGYAVDGNGSPLASATSITEGPATVENGLYRNMLFITTSGGQMFAVTPNKAANGVIQPEPVFVNGRKSISIPGGATGITFSNIDYNLWHRTYSSADPVYVSPDGVRPENEYATNNNQNTDGYAHPGSQYDWNHPAGASWYFGIDDPRWINTDSVDPQPGVFNWEQVNQWGAGNQSVFGTYDVPGGAYGALTSNSFSLEGYAKEDKPALYFTYRYSGDKENLVDANGNPVNYKDDAPIVYISADGGTWEAVSTGIFYQDVRTQNGQEYNRSYWDRTNDADYNSLNTQYRDETHIIDILENDDAWRQAKVDLSKFAGAKDIKIKFVFSTSGGQLGLGTWGNPSNQKSSSITAVAPDKILDGRSTQPGLPDGTLTKAQDSGFRIDNVTFQYQQGYSLYVPVTPGEYTNGGQITLTINGQAVKVNIPKAMSAEQAMTAIISQVNAALSGMGIRAMRTVDCYGKASGQCIYFEGANTFSITVPVSGGFTIFGGAQDRFLENLQNMTSAQFATLMQSWRNGTAVVPIPFRADMSTQEIAATTAFMINIVFNDSLIATLSQAGNAPAVRTMDQFFEFGTGFGTIGVAGMYDPRQLKFLFTSNDGYGNSRTNLLERVVKLDSSMIWGVSGYFSDYYSYKYLDGVLHTYETHKTSPYTNSVQMILTGHTITPVNITDPVTGRTSSRLGPLYAQVGDYEGTRYYNTVNSDPANPVYDPVYVAGDTSNGDYGEYLANDRTVHRATSNQNTGFYIDNIIIGFAGRGEMVTNAPVNTGFTASKAYAEYFVASGSYQLEIRRGDEYTDYTKNTKIHDDANLLTLFNVYERMGDGISLISPDASGIAHNQRFTITDGVNKLTFIFINEKFGGGSGDDIKIVFNDLDDNLTIKVKIVDAINTAFNKGLFKVRATTSRFHQTIDLFGATDFQNITAGATPIKHIFYGVTVDQNDGRVAYQNNEVVYAYDPTQPRVTNSGNVDYNNYVAKDRDFNGFLESTASRLYIDTYLGNRYGDNNTVREKGQLNIFGSSISYSSDYGILIGPGDNDTAAARQQSSDNKLVPGIAVTSNVLSFNGAGGLTVIGTPEESPFVRVLNNTIYGGTAATGIGINLGDNTAATVMNNVFANLSSGVAVAKSSENNIVYRSNTYQGNTSNGQGAEVEKYDAQILAAGEPLFVNPARGNFYPAPGSRIIDSSTGSLLERIEWYNATLRQLGIPQSVIFAPDFDMYGQLRAYNEGSSSSGGTGGNPAMDRGAIDRVDFSKPTASLINPVDVTELSSIKTTGDQNPARDDIFIIAEYYNQFVIQLDDVGIGIDDLSVADAQGTVLPSVLTLVEETWDGNKWVQKTLVQGTDFFANYNTANDQIYLTPVRGQWSSDANYIITLNNGPDGICDLAGNPLNQNRSDGTVVFKINLTGYDYGDAPDPTYPTLPTSDGPRHVVYHGFSLGQNVSVDYAPYTSPYADGDVFDDGVKMNQSDLVAGMKNTFTITIRDDNALVKASRAAGAPIGYLTVWVDWDNSGDFDWTKANSNYTELYTFTVTKAGEMTITIDAPRYMKDGVTELTDSYVFARFRLCSVNEVLAVNPQTGLPEVYHQLLPTGIAKDGEVEDYRFHMVKNLKDFGDAPETYAPKTGMDAWHAVDLLWGYDKNNPTKPMLGKESELVAGSGKQLYLGDKAPTSKSAPSYSEHADGDPDESPNPLTGLWFVANEELSLAGKIKVNIPAALKAKMTADPTVKVYLNAWFDVNGDKVWSDDEHLLNNYAIGLNDLDANGYLKNVTVKVPASAQRGEFVARFRLSTSKISSPYGPEIASGIVYDGEVEDQVFNALDKRRDFGEAPGNANTLYDSGGAAHAIVRDAKGNPSLSLGTKVDEEIDGTPAKNIADLKSMVIADNDGLINWRLVVGQTSYILVTATNTTTTDAYLNIWVDLNQNGVFDDVGEKLISNFVVKAGTPAGTQFQLKIDKLPTEVTLKSDGKTKEAVILGDNVMRMRLSHQKDIGPRGSTIVVGGVKTDIDGEVEDHVVSIQTPTADVSGTIYQDLNADAKRQIGKGEAGLAGLIVYVDLNGDGKFSLDQFGVLEPYAVTDANGNYVLKGLWNTTGDQKYKIRVLKDASDLGNITGIAAADKTAIDAALTLLKQYDEYVLSTQVYQYEVAVPDSTAIIGKDFGYFAKPHLSISDVSVVEGNVGTDGKAVRTEVSLEISMKNKYGTNVAADVWVAYDTILTTLGLHLADAGLKYQVLVADAATGDFEPIVHAATAATNNVANAGWVKLTGVDAKTASVKIKVVVLGDTTVERDEMFQVKLSAASYVEFLKNLVASDGKTALASVVIEKGMGNVVIINDDGSLNYGNAPATYGPTQLADAGARHGGPKTLWLGSTIDYTAAPVTNGTDKDNDGVRGYNGVASVGYVDMNNFLFLTGATNRLEVTVHNSTGKQAYLVAWMDLNGDGVWNSATEQVIGTSGNGIKVSDGINYVTVNVPANAKLGETWVRFRLSTDETLPLGSMAMNGEVEDYKVKVVDNRIDYGSAPATYGDVGHILKPDANGNYTGPYLGNRVIPEFDPKSVYSNNANAFDDDGVTIKTVKPGTGTSYANALYAGTWTTITVNASQGGVLSMWVDTNGDGDFLDAGERIMLRRTGDTGNGATYLTLSPGSSISIDVLVPSTDLPTNVQTTFARFRLTDSTVDHSKLGPTGIAANGEAEDYKVSILTKSSTFAGTVYNDLNANGKLDQNYVATQLPEVSLVPTKGTNVPLTSIAYSTITNPGLSSGYYSLDSLGQINQFSSGYYPLGFYVELGGKQYQYIRVTDKGALMFISDDDQLSGATAGVPTLYGADTPTFAPFLSNMINETVTCGRGYRWVTLPGDNDTIVTARQDFVTITWGGKFGIQIVNSIREISPADAKKTIAPVGDLVTFFYSDDFIASIASMPAADIAANPVQIGTNFGNARVRYGNADVLPIAGRDATTYSSNTDLSAFFSSLQRGKSEMQDVGGNYLDGNYQYLIHRLNPVQGFAATTGYRDVASVAIDDKTTVIISLPTEVVIYESLMYKQMFYINTSNSSKYVSTNIYSFGFWFDFGGRRYDSYVVYDNGTIGLVNAYGQVDARLVAWSSYLAAKPTVDLVEGTSSRGNKFVQIRWNSAFGIYVENDAAGDIVEFFYTNNAYTSGGGVDLGGLTGSHVYTNSGSVAGFTYADGSGVNSVSEVFAGLKSYIGNQADFKDFLAKTDRKDGTGSKIVYRFNATTGKAYAKEPGLAGAVVQIEDKDGNVIATQTTGLDGYYSFAGLYPGDYVLRSFYNENNPKWIQTEPKTGNFQNVSVDEQKTTGNKNFGYYQKGTLEIVDTKVVEGNDKNTKAQVEVRLNDSFGAPITVNYSTKDGTAVSGQDYTGGSGSATLQPQLLPNGTWDVQTLDLGSTSSYDRSISGDMIAYEMFDGTRWNVYVYNTVSGGTPTRLALGGNDRMPSIVQTGDSKTGTVRLTWSSYNPTLKKYQIYYSESPVGDLAKLNEEWKPGMSYGYVCLTDEFLGTKNSENQSPQVSAYQNPGGGQEVAVTWSSTGSDGKTYVYCIGTRSAIYNSRGADSPNIVRLENSTAATQLKMYGQYVVWSQQNAASIDIMLYDVINDVASKKAKIISSAGTSTSPVIYGDHVAWEFVPAGTTAPAKIAVYSIKDGTINYYSMSNLECRAPSLSDEWLVWQERASGSKTNDKYDIMAFNLKTGGAIRNITVSNTEDDTSPQVVGNRLVWRAYIKEGYTTGTDWEVRYVDLSIQDYVPVTLSKAGVYDWNPVLTDSMVVWRSQASGATSFTLNVAKYEPPVIKAYIPIEIIGDTVVEPDETFTITITKVTGNLADIGRNIATVTILNDDGPVILNDKNVNVGGLDFGDAPVSYGTLLADDGARHVIVGTFDKNTGRVVPTVGLSKYCVQNPNPSADELKKNPPVWVDAETNGKPTTDAKGDDTTTSNDEDGVEFIGTWTVGNKAYLKVYAISDCGMNLWIDWNQNGRFGDMATGSAEDGEFVNYTNLTNPAGYHQLVPGENLLEIEIPNNAKVGKTFARFRVVGNSSRNYLDNELKWFGSAPDGEVEDHQITISKGSAVASNVYIDSVTNTLAIRGTAMADVITIQKLNDGNSVSVVFNGTTYNFTKDQMANVKTITVDGIAGDDKVTINALFDEQVVTLKPGEAKIIGGGISVSVVNAKNITYNGKIGKDTVELHDAQGQDTVELWPNKGTMKSSDGSMLTINSVKIINVFSDFGGDDVATLNGSASADTVMAFDNTVNMAGNNPVYLNTVVGFGNMTINAVKNQPLTNLDVISVFEKRGSNVSLEVDSEKGKLTRPSQTATNQNYSLVFNNFNTVMVTSLGGYDSNNNPTVQGANNIAKITGSAGADSLVAGNSLVTLTGKRTDGAAYTIQVSNFTQNIVDGGAGKDSAYYNASGRGDYVKVIKENGVNAVDIFDATHVDHAWLELLAFENATFDAKGNKATKSTAQLINDNLLALNFIGDWTEVPEK